MNQRSQCFHSPRHASTPKPAHPTQDEMSAQLIQRQEWSEESSIATRPFNEWMNLFSSCCNRRYCYSQIGVIRRFAENKDILRSNTVVSTSFNQRQPQKGSDNFFGKELSTRDCSLSEAELNSGSSQEAQRWRAHVERIKTLTAEVKRKRAQRMVIARVECKMKRIYTQPRLGQVA